MFEMWQTGKLVHLRVTLPRADSKLDKERETKKDFKEKVAIMNTFYKGVHAMQTSSALEGILNFIFRHTKASMELIYVNGQAQFQVVTYQAYAKTFVQQITSNYPDAEVRILDKKEIFDVKPRGYALRTASFGKKTNDIYPIKTYKYFEDDPLSTFTNAFGSLQKDDRAVYQIVIKPLSDRWNKYAKKSASLVAKGQFRRGNKNALGLEIFNIIIGPLSWLVDRFINNTEGGSTTAPGASSGDAYKIFNQAEQESQKAVGESAGQPAFQASIRVLVASKNAATAESGIATFRSAFSIFSDEYNNKIATPTTLEGIRFFFVPLRYFAYYFRLVGILQSKNVFSTDELTTMFHFPDINYNKSPIIKWLEYKMISPPHNIKVPTEKLTFTDYVRDLFGNIKTKDGSLLKVDKNKNIVRDEHRNFVTTKNETVMVVQEGEMRGKTLEESKAPLTEETPRTLGGFPLYKDGVLL